jgi:hypothetical protein
MIPGLAGPFLDSVNRSTGFAARSAPVMTAFAGRSRFFRSRVLAGGAGPVPHHLAGRFLNPSRYVSQQRCFPDGSSK